MSILVEHMYKQYVISNSISWKWALDPQKLELPKAVHDHGVLRNGHRPFTR